MSVHSRLSQMLAAVLLSSIMGMPSAFALEHDTGVVQPPSAFPLLTKTTDKSEVLPGGRIRFTIRVQNVLLAVLRDAEVTERFDDGMLTIVDSAGATEPSPEALQWTLPPLAPGAVWEVTYVLAVHPDIPHDSIVSTIATISGEDVRHAPLQETVVVTSVGVVGTLPAAGAPLDVLFLLTSLPIALMLTGIQRTAPRSRLHA